jgi:hypothetical protein
MLNLRCGKYKTVALIMGVLLLSILFVGCTQRSESNPSYAVSIGERTKTSGCVVNGVFPDKACTPGSINISATQKDLCTPGYTSDVRDVSDRLKEEVYAEYGIKTHTTGQYEIDHFIPLALGGSNDISNLFPEAAEPRPGFHEKDVVETYLHRQVCNGVIPLTEAQRSIATNWLTIYNSIK